MSIDAADLEALADRCEREAGSRLLDVQIGSLIREGAIISPGRLPRDPTANFEPLESVWPKYTTSLDAAVTLVPEGQEWSLDCLRTVPSTAWLPVPDIMAKAHTPALALCAAALRARATIEGKP